MSNVEKFLRHDRLVVRRRVIKVDKSSGSSLHAPFFLIQLGPLSAHHDSRGKRYASEG